MLFKRDKTKAYFTSVQKIHSKTTISRIKKKLALKYNYMFILDIPGSLKIYRFDVDISRVSVSLSPAVRFNIAMACDLWKFPICDFKVQTEINVTHDFHSKREILK